MKNLVNFIGYCFVVFIFFSCANESMKDLRDAQRLDKNSFGAEMKVTEKNQSSLLKSQPQPTTEYSLERENLTKRFERFNDENKVSYIYLVNYGRIMAFYPLKGKVSSVNSMLSNPEQIIQFPVVDRSGSINKYDTHVVSSSAEDGSYGINGDAIFFFTTDDTYVEWRGDYMLCDKPLKLSQEPLMVMSVNKNK